MNELVRSQGTGLQKASSGLVRRGMDDVLELVSIQTGELPPKIFQAFVRITVFHIEAHYREGNSYLFWNYLRDMVTKYGDRVRPHLSSFYEAARIYPGFEEIAITMSSSEDIDVIMWLDSLPEIQNELDDSDAQMYAAGNNKPITSLIGINTEQIPIALKIAKIYVEAGWWNFSEFAVEMSDHFAKIGYDIHERLQQLYSMVRSDPDLPKDIKDQMDGADYVDNLSEEDIDRMITHE